MRQEEITKWLDGILPHHERLTEVLVPLIQGLIRQNKIELLNVTGRTKERSAILEKVARKSYKDPASQLTDLTGIRIITFFDQHVQQVSELIRQVFDVDETNSLAIGGGVDKEIIDELNRFGISNIIEFISLIEKNKSRIFEDNVLITYAGVIRYAMMLEDIDRYFSDAWGRDWTAMLGSMFRELSKDLGEENVRRILKDNSIAIFEDR